VMLLVVVSVIVHSICLGSSFPEAYEIELLFEFPTEGLPLLETVTVAESEQYSPKPSHNRISTA